MDIRQLALSHLATVPSRHFIDPVIQVDVAATTREEGSVHDVRTVLAAMDIDVP